MPKSIVHWKNIVHRITPCYYLMDKSYTTLFQWSGGMPFLHVTYADGSTWLVSQCDVILAEGDVQHLTAHDIGERVLNLFPRLKRIAGSMNQWGCNPSLTTLQQVETFIEQLEDTQQARELARERVKHLRMELQKVYDKTFVALGRRDGFDCQRCHTSFNLDIDHVLALIHGGTNDLDNLQLLCGSCNSRKGDRE